jgi:peptidoglycan/xylan/chitin deacetylase (PgdA/CDA1 family)
MKIISILFALILSSKAAIATEVSITMDDFNVQEATLLAANERNDRILDTLNKQKIKAALFVVGKFIQDNAAQKLLAQWDQRGHLIGNHTFNHLYFGSKMSVELYEEEILRCEKLLTQYSNFKKILRFPMLAEGDTAEKRDLLRAWLLKNGYKNGYVTIDASDWYIDQRLREKIKLDPKFDLTKYRDFYLEHMWDRAQYYNTLSKKVLGREVKHTLLVHFNLLNALFLNDLIEMFKKRGWKIINAADAFRDPAYGSSPNSMPSGQNLVWALAKESGKYEGELRYPAEDGDYEKEKMDKLGL